MICQHSKVSHGDPICQDIADSKIVSVGYFILYADENAEFSVYL